MLTESFVLSFSLANVEYTGQGRYTETDQEKTTPEQDMDIFREAYCWFLYFDAFLSLLFDEILCTFYKSKLVNLL